ncbi:MAG TPA: hypothetical protein VFO19_05190, partial [Vicinamibacterales bacterium]|nr:hypothetical protein [Vicinamibacterales bacterium]
MSIVLSRRPPGVGVLVRRAAILYALGLLLALYPRFDFSTVRLVGVPRLAICYLAAATIYRGLASADESVRSRITLA